MFDVEQTICEQYANSPVIDQLIANMAQYMDPTQDFINFYTFVWNVRTAQFWGLDILGRIVGVSRVLKIPGASGFFGFANSSSPPDWQGWGNKNNSAAGGPFFAGQALTGSFTLLDDAYRTLILVKALANIVATTIPSLNQLLRNLFPGRGRCYVIDRGKMAMSYVFEFSLTNIERAILDFSGVMPAPAGVLVSIVEVPSGYFGFNESGNSQHAFQETGLSGAFYNPGASF